MGRAWCTAAVRRRGARAPFPLRGSRCSPNGRLSFSSGGNTSAAPPSPDPRVGLKAGLFNEYGVLPTTQMNPVTDGFLATLGIALEQGRDFGPADRMGAPPVVIVSEALASLAWPGGSPLGQRLRVVGQPDVVATVVGVVANIQAVTLREPVGPQLYLPKAQNPGIFSSVAARTVGDPDALGPAVRGAIWSLDPDQPVWKIRSIRSLLERDVAPQRFTMALAGGFALVALLLAVVGVYGVISYTVARRTRDLGIRMAFGAARGQVVRMVLWGGLRMVARPRRSAWWRTSASVRTRTSAPGPHRYALRSALSSCRATYLATTISRPTRPTPSGTGWPRAPVWRSTTPPTYGSWLNQVELWFAKIKRDCIARGICTSALDLLRKLLHYIRAHQDLSPVSLELLNTQSPAPCQRTLERQSTSCHRQAPR